MEEMSHMGGVDPISRWTDNISKAENANKFSSGLRFRCSWARWNRNEELYKNMQRNIIVQHRSEERRVGKECASMCRSRRCDFNEPKNIENGVRMQKLRPFSYKGFLQFSPRR